MIKLFLIFLKIGLFTFGGGYAMIPHITQDAKSLGLTTYEITDFIAISEATPGPFAVNLATFIGYRNYGVIGAIISTIGVTLPSFVTIILIAIFINKLRNKRFFKLFIKFSTPIVIGLILSAVVKLTNENFFSISNIYNLTNEFKLNLIPLISFLILLAIYIGYYLIKKKRISPLLVIIISIFIGSFTYLFLSL